MSIIVLKPVSAKSVTVLISDPYDIIMGITFVQFEVKHMLQFIPYQLVYILRNCVSRLTSIFYATCGTCSAVEQLQVLYTSITQYLLQTTKLYLTITHIIV